MTICSDLHCTVHYGCRLKRKGIMLAPDALPTRTASIRSRDRVLREPESPSWEAGVAGEHRPDGSFSPYLDAEGSPMGVKEFSEKRHVLEEGRRRLESDPNVFASERSNP